jgi:patatin-like phospholipase/acyl hydrolase
MVIGFALAPVCVAYLKYAGFPFYSRVGLDGEAQDKLGDATFSDVQVTELLIASYEYNSQTPRFFSKYFEKMDPGQYEVPLKIAVGASSSAPTYFDPLTWNNSYGIMDTLVDGGIICNNPAFYAYVMAKYFYNQTDVRVLSLGTGIPKEDDD